MKIVRETDGIFFFSMTVTVTGLLLAGTRKGE